ncbi:MAG TPA: TIGR03621 family F420-dependent LLM class oxidoreductase [Acidimicrobiales bacterium]|nr:TIGR03621 family F420-dependent LLM class oxidoreductase [Acidimicrobiales bacterium]
MRPFRFSVQHHAASDGNAWRDLARKTEDLGYTTLYLPDHFGDQWSPTIAMTIAAEVTQNLRVGALVYDVDYRHPITQAKEVATLDVAFPGRVIFGFGAGWMKTDYDESGIAYDSPGTRINRMQEALTIMKALWADGTCTFRGEHYTITNAQGFPRPSTPGGPPVLIGGGGKKVLTIAAQMADTIGVNPNLRSGAVDAETAKSAMGDVYRERMQWIRDAAGDRFDSLDLQVLTFMTQIVDNRDEVLANIAPLFGVTPEEAADIPLAMVGTVDQIVESLQKRREEFGFNDIVVQGDAMDAFAPVVAKLAGT